MTYNRDLKWLKYIVIIFFVLYNIAEITLNVMNPPYTIDIDYVSVIVGLVLTDIYYLTLIWLVGSITKLGDKYYQLMELHRGESKLLKTAKEEE